MLPRAASLLVPVACLLSGLLLPARPAGAQGPAPRVQWDRTLGGTPGSISEAGLAGSCTATADGGCLVVGKSNSGVGGVKTQPSRGSYDVWVVKLDAAGAKQWDRTFGGAGYDDGAAGQQTADGGYIVVGTSDSPAGGDRTDPSRGNSDAWVIKLDAAGAKQWDRAFGGAGSDGADAVQQTADGGYVLGCGSTSGVGGDKSEPSRGYVDYWVVKLDGQGRKVWDRTYGGGITGTRTGVNLLRSVRQTPDGGYVVAGQSDSDAGGDKSEPSRGYIDYWLLKLDGQGRKVWDRTYGGSGTDADATALPTADGGYLAGGTSSSGVGGDKSEPNRGFVDYWVVKLDAAGTKQWDRTFGGAESDYCWALAQTPGGGYVAGGESSSGAGGDRTPAQRGLSDYWLVGFDAAGAQRWDGAYGGPDRNALRALALTADGGLVAAGTSSSGVGGDKTQPAYGAFDLWVVKLAPLGLGARAGRGAAGAVQVYPVPAAGGEVRVRGLAGLGAGLALVLADGLGRAVAGAAVAAGATEGAVAVGGLAAGAYVLRVTDGRGRVLATRPVLLR